MMEYSYIIAAIAAGCFFGFITEYIIKCIHKINKRNEYKIGDIGYIQVMNHIDKCIIVAKKNKEYIVEDIDDISKLNHEKFLVKKDEFFL